MPEGVECLIVAENIQSWFQEQDLNEDYELPFYLEKIYEKIICRNSPIPFENFNKFYKKIDYRRISTFGKVIFLPSTTGYCLSIQLGMSGTFDKTQKDHSKLKFGSIYESLYYIDPRKFGNLMFFNQTRYPRNIKNLIKNSIDWRDKEAPQKFAKRVRTKNCWRNKSIKTLLLNQQLIAGIGNIYACEGLFISNIDPRLTIDDLNNKELILIIQNCQKIMNKSYQVGGMTVKSFSSMGKKGFGKKYLSVYNKQGLPCKKCYGAIIQNIKIDKRSTFFCPNCQKRTGT